MRNRYRITSKREDGTTKVAVRYSKEAAAGEARRQLFDGKCPSEVRIAVDRPKGDVV